MSANNQVVIHRKQNGLYKIDDIDVDTDMANTHVADDIDGLDNAVEKANKYLEECEDEGYPVEYGLRIENRS